MKSHSILLLLGSVLLSACTNSETSGLSFDWLNRTPASAEITLNSGGPLTPGQRAYDVKHYTLDHVYDPGRKSIDGSSEIQALILEETPTLELDFDARFKISSVLVNGQEATFTRANGKFIVNLSGAGNVGETVSVLTSYIGRPHVATDPPWKGGFIWETTSSGDPIFATAIQGEGCDVWWPCKDHPSDEAESVDIILTVPPALTALSNGTLLSQSTEPNGWQKFHWHTDHATNDYAVTINVAPYQKIEQNYRSVNGSTFPVEFWHLPENSEKAQRLFDEHIIPYIAFFEEKVGPYPWAPEKAGFVETTFYGMEHQTLNAYGADYAYEGYPNYALLHHELAHEWFGNKVTVKDWSDFWIHEGFGTFMQPIYLLETRGEAAFHAWIFKAYEGTTNCEAIAPRGEYREREMYGGDSGPGGDIYAKASLVLFSLKYLMGEERFWRFVREVVYDSPKPERLPLPLKALHRDTDDVMTIASKVAGEDLGWFFEVYFRTGSLPVLEVERNADTLTLAWQTEGSLPFPMPVPIEVNGKKWRVEMATGHANLKVPAGANVIIDPQMAVLRQLPFKKTCEAKG